ncbi:type I methionyl aminopeptidase [candidate division KSB1 bacterium]|nr:type I methionyl aminopeptidase [candidate division KSB1 bacterium]
MINRRSTQEIDLIRSSAKILVDTFRMVDKYLEPGLKTIDIDKKIEQFIVKAGGRPAFKGHKGFPGSSCISIDEVVVHGIPDDKVIEEGQLISIDIGVEYKKYYSDAARTFALGELTPEKENLKKITEESLEKGIEKVVEGNRISDISMAIQNYVEPEGFSLVRDLVGHGIGSSLWEEPEIPNYYDERKGIQPKIMAGMVFAIEPMVNIGKHGIKFLNDGWTVVTTDLLPSAHFEHTVVVTDNGPEILTTGR